MAGASSFGSITSGSDAKVKEAVFIAANTHDGTTTNSAGTLQTTAVGLPISATTPANANPIANNAIWEFNQSTTGTYPDAINGSGTVNKTGKGLLSLTGANTFAGLTTVLAGRLGLDSSVAGGAAVSPPVVLGTQTTAQVQGISTISGGLTVNAGCIHKPGNRPGIQTVNGSYNINSGALLIEANSNVPATTPGTGYSQVLVNGPVTLGGGCRLELAVRPGHR